MRRWERTMTIGCMLVCGDCGVRHEIRPVRLIYFPANRRSPAVCAPLCDQCSGYVQPPPPAPLRGRS